MDQGWLAPAVDISRRFSYQQQGATILQIMLARGFDHMVLQLFQCCAINYFVQVLVQIFVYCL
jgi:hypothetical protein